MYIMIIQSYVYHIMIMYLCNRYITLLILLHITTLLSSVILGRVRSTQQAFGVDNSHVQSLNALSPHAFKRENDER